MNDRQKSHLRRAETLLVEAVGILEALADETENVAEGQIMQSSYEEAYATLVTISALVNDK